MRRLALSCAFLVLAAPAAALAAHDAAGDGSLVVKHGSTTGGPVVVLKVTGSVIGEVDGGGKIIIDSGPGPVTPEVTGAGPGKPVPTDPTGTAQYWRTGADNFKFRAVGGTFFISIYGTDVNLVALGKGWVRLQGSTDTPRIDGKFSLNGDDFKSLPGVQTDKLLFPANG
jgi:hypothetical protein